jgi:hypothetical protein
VPDWSANAAIGKTSAAIAVALSSLDMVSPLKILKTELLLSSSMLREKPSPRGH